MQGPSPPPPPPNFQNYAPAIYGYVVAQPPYPYMLPGQVPQVPAGASPSPVMNEVACDAGGATSTSPPVTLLSAKEARGEISITKWLRGGWHLYRENWMYFSGFQLVVLCVEFLLPLAFLFLFMASNSDYHHQRDGAKGPGPKAGGPQGSGRPAAGHNDPFDSPMVEMFDILFSLMTWPLYLGHVFVGLAVLRAKVYGVGYSLLGDDEPGNSVVHSLDSETDGARVRFVDFLSGYYLYLPLLGLVFVHSLLLIAGLLCFIAPGLYLIVALSFVELLYIEYHHSLTRFDRYSSEPQPFSFWQAFIISVERVHPHFWRMAGFLIILLGIVYLGALTVVGSLITVPLTCLCMVIAFEDLFGLRQDKVKEYTCTYSC